MKGKEEVHKKVEAPGERSFRIELFLLDEKKE